MYFLCARASVGTRAMMMKNIHPALALMAFTFQGVREAGNK